MQSAFLATFIYITLSSHALAQFNFDENIAMHRRIARTWRDNANKIERKSVTKKVIASCVKSTANAAYAYECAKITKNKVDIYIADQLAIAAHVVRKVILVARIAEDFYYSSLLVSYADALADYTIPRSTMVRTRGHHFYDIITIHEYRRLLQYAIESHINISNVPSPLSTLLLGQAGQIRYYSKEEQSINPTNPTVRLREFNLAIANMQLQRQNTPDPTSHQFPIIGSEIADIEESRRQPQTLRTLHDMAAEETTFSQEQTILREIRIQTNALLLTLNTEEPEDLAAREEGLHTASILDTQRNYENYWVHSIDLAEAERRRETDRAARILAAAQIRNQTFNHPGPRTLPTSFDDELIKKEAEHPTQIIVKHIQDLHKLPHNSEARTKLDQEIQDTVVAWAHLPDSRTGTCIIGTEEKPLRLLNVLDCCGKTIEPHHMLTWFLINHTCPNCRKKQPSFYPFPQSQAQ